MVVPDLRGATPQWKKPVECMACGNKTLMLYSGARLPEGPFKEIKEIVVRDGWGRERGRRIVLPSYSKETYDIYACRSCGFWILKNPS